MTPQRGWRGHALTVKISRLLLESQEIMNKATCLSLLSNAVVVWNTVQMTRIIDQLRAGGESITDEELARISPFAFAHVIPNGTYFARQAAPANRGEHSGPIGLFDGGRESDM
jgi:hypothetical protein